MKSRRDGVRHAFVVDVEELNGLLPGSRFVPKCAARRAAEIAVKWDERRTAKAKPDEGFARRANEISHAASRISVAHDGSARETLGKTPESVDAAYSYPIPFDAPWSRRSAHIIDGKLRSGRPTQTPDRLQPSPKR